MIVTVVMIRMLVTLGRTVVVVAAADTAAAAAAPEY